MDWVRYLFSFEGRINRAKFWLAGLITFCWTMFLIMLVFIPVAYLFDGPQKLHVGFENIFAIYDPQSYHGLSRPDLCSIVVNAIVMPPVLWVFLATAVKRLHDRDRSGWWLVLFFAVPGSCGQFADLRPELSGPLRHLADPRLLPLGCH